MPAMDNSVFLGSTFFLTLLMMVGLFFFIRASAKDRTQVVRMTSSRSEDDLLAELRRYFTDRAYTIQRVDAEKNQVELSGFVQPSLFLAIFLATMAGVGGLCLGLVLSIAVPRLPYIWIAFLGFAPLAGRFYWLKAGRQETVSFRLESSSPDQNRTGSIITVSAHRDEMETLQETLQLTPLDYF
jgi:Flp pilus assembly protein TadB